MVTIRPTGNLAPYYENGHGLLSKPTRTTERGIDMARNSLLALILVGVCTHSGGVYAAQPGGTSSVPCLRCKAVSGIRIPPILPWRAMAVNGRAGGGRLNGSFLYGMIPVGVRLAGPEAVSEYLKNHHLSHIRSVRWHPKLVAHPGNLVFEPAPWNLARGAKDMTWSDRLRVSVHNGWTGGIAGARALFMNVAKGAGIGMVAALPVELIVGTLDVRNGHATVPEAVLVGAATVSVFGLAGGAISGAATVAGASGFALGAPVVVPLMVVGGTVYVLVAGGRVWDALPDETRAEFRERGAAVVGVIQENARAVGGVVSKWATANFEKVRGGVTALQARGSDAPK